MLIHIIVIWNDSLITPIFSKQPGITFNGPQHIKVVGLSLKTPEV
ncbi:hypothetical protein Niako_5149 [Niastella koreensis GR20-10]|uniref:Uncharacterized protein n=1 Tax=Niastella koreensis (strain DSM 17620 / KACC 11465 / NBRC 106392 / GR20-10) TaxID=700598 RepID=G8TB41_NIAKG|nr:hypothetical protein Niako_5149 [Niastella koreensis GR20-10]